MFDFDIVKKTKTDVFESTDIWDALIIGGGPAGLNAALYLQRKGKTVGVITKEIGGQLHNTSEVDNYLGFTHILGKQLSDTFLDHTNHLNIPILNQQEITSVTKTLDIFYIKTSLGKTFKSKTLLYATGGKPKMLDIPGEVAYANKGVSYCTTCDAPFFKDKHVIVSGGGNSAAEAVLDLVPYASKITVIHRSLWRADQVLLDKHKDIEKLDVKLQTKILEIRGNNDHMTSLLVLNTKTNETYEVLADGIFIEIGTIPNSHLVKDLVDCTESNEIIVNGFQETSLPGLFAAGDVTNQPYKQIIIATAEGAKAALRMNQFLNN